MRRLLLALALASPAVPGAPLQIEGRAPGTYVLREDLAVTWEAPFLYLLVGRDQALLIDTGDVADPRTVPLARTVLGLLPDGPGGKLPLLVVHSHGHLDHRSGDAQFAGLPGVQVIPAGLGEVRAAFGFTRWPEGAAQVDLGGRIVDVLPAPGHQRAHLVFYDRTTGTLFTGDFLMPARLLVEDTEAYRASARRLAAFVRDLPVREVLGGHIEKNRAGELYPWQAQEHPDEAPLALGKADVLALPGALDHFNGLRTRSGPFVMMNGLRILETAAAGGLALLASLAAWIFRRFRRRRTARQSNP